MINPEELAHEVKRVTGSPEFGAHLAQGSWGTILKPAAFNGQLCFGPSVGQRVQFTRPSSWLGAAFTPINAQAVGPEIARRFLSAYGPATYQDLARWWDGDGVATARKRIAALSEEVVSVGLNVTKAWMLAAGASKLRDLPPIRAIRLLPAFDSM